MTVPIPVSLITGFLGAGKTSLLATLARAEAKRIQERKAEKEGVFYVTWEQVAEEINLILDVNTSYTASDVMRGEVDIETIKFQARKRVKLPIWVIGSGENLAGDVEIHDHGRADVVHVPRDVGVFAEPLGQEPLRP